MFTIPVEPASPTAMQTAQSKVYPVDLDILIAASADNGVVSGCAVTAQATPDGTVAVAAGSVRVDTLYWSVTGASTNIVTAGGTGQAADATNPRFSIVVVNAGAIAVRHGTAAALPLPPTLTAGDTALATIYVPAAATTIPAANIIDKRATAVGTSTGVQLSPQVGIGTPAIVGTALIIQPILTSPGNAIGINENITLQPAANNSSYFFIVGGVVETTAANNGIAAATGLFINPVNRNNAGVIANTYGIQVAAQPANGGNAYAIYTQGTTPSVFGGNISALNLDDNGIFEPKQGVAVASNVTQAASTTYYQYLGKATRAYTSAVVRLSVATAGVTLSFAEVGIFKGAIATLGTVPLLTKVATAAATLTAIAKVSTTVPLTGVLPGDDLWAVVGVGTQVTAVAYSAAVPDILSTAITASNTAQPSATTTTTPTLTAAAIPALLVKFS